MCYWIKHILPLSYIDEYVNHPNKSDCCIPPESHGIVFMFEMRLYYNIANVRRTSEKKRDQVRDPQRVRCGYIARICNQRIIMYEIMRSPLRYILVFLFGGVSLVCLFLLKINRSHVTDPSSKERLGVRSAVKRIFAWGKREDGLPIPSRMKSVINSGIFSRGWVMWAQRRRVTLPHVRTSALIHPGQYLGKSYFTLGKLASGRRVVARPHGGILVARWNLRLRYGIGQDRN